MFSGKDGKILETVRRNDTKSIIKSVSDLYSNYKLVCTLICISGLYAIDYLRYVYKMGYYSAFGIPEEFMLQYSNHSIIYMMIFFALLTMAYICYLIFAARLFTNYKNRLCALLVIGITQFFITLFFYYGNDIYYGINMSFEWSKFHIIMIVFVGWITGEPIFKTIISLCKGNIINHEKSNTDKFIILKFVVVLFMAVILIYQIYGMGRKNAEIQHSASIVEMNSKMYFVVDNDNNNLILAECRNGEDNSKQLVVLKNTYLKIKNDKEIEFKIFEKISIE